MIPVWLITSVIRLLTQAAVKPHISCTIFDVLSRFVSKYVLAVCIACIAIVTHF